MSIPSDGNGGVGGDHGQPVVDVGVFGKVGVGQRIDAAEALALGATERMIGMQGDLDDVGQWVLFNAYSWHGRWVYRRSFLKAHFA